MPLFFRFFFGWIFPWIFIVAGILVMSSGTLDWIQARDSLKWPRVPGVILSSEIKRAVGTGGAAVYRPELKYKYTVAGRELISSRIAFGLHSSKSTAQAGRLIRAHPPNTPVTVSYNPTNPNQAVLQPGAQGPLYLVPIFGFALLVVGSYLAVILPRKVGIATKLYPTSAV